MANQTISGGSRSPRKRQGKTKRHDPNLRPRSDRERDPLEPEDDYGRDTPRRADRDMGDEDED